MPEHTLRPVPGSQVQWSLNDGVEFQVAEFLAPTSLGGTLLGDITWKKFCRSPSAVFGVTCPCTNLWQTWLQQDGAPPHFSASAENWPSAQSTLSQSVDRSWMAYLLASRAAGLDVTRFLSLRAHQDDSLHNRTSVYWQI